MSMRTAQQYHFWETFLLDPIKQPWTKRVPTTLIKEDHNIIIEPCKDLVNSTWTKDTTVCFN